MHKPLKLHLQKFTNASEEELEKFCQLFEYKEVSKKSFLLEEGQICRFEAFVLDGLLKVFLQDANAHEQILFFAAADWWVTDFDSFDNQIPATLGIQALEDTKLLTISYENKKWALENLPFVPPIFFAMIKRTHIALQRRFIKNLSQTADVRYTDFLRQYPHIAHRLSNIQIAAYLGVSHEFVSKIRNKITKSLP
ncbi:MAG: Crp/Fnr family transcriptional regulator [Capnocytophaga sp.]|nr:Crp/Fnr family transcriptional regulator [Capnocytophaga sp.]